MSWKHLSFILGALCAWQTWRGCTRHDRVAKDDAQAECTTESPTIVRNYSSSSSSDERRSTPDDEQPPAETGAGLPSINGFKLPAWTLWFAPQPGESMLSYRDRMIPIAQTALAPHRARVARGRDDFAAKVALDSQQRAELDAAVQEAQTQIQDKVMSSLLAGELAPKNFKPMTGVTLARDVLDSVARANTRFMATLREDQKAKLGQHPFDFADYLLFSARWEDALGVTN
jgi:hypothetical protein